MAPLKPLALLALVPAFTLLASPMASQAAYSHNPLAPTKLTGSPTVTIQGTLINGSNPGGAGVSPTSDYVTFRVPYGKVFTGLNLTSYTSTDDRSFVALMPGKKWTTAPSSGALPGALAYSHFGTRGLCSLVYGDRIPSGTYNKITNNCVTNPAGQSNLFVKSLTGPLAAPLKSGDYSVWIQNTGPEETAYVFEAQFESVKAPGPLPILGAAAGLGFSRRLRQRIRSAKPQG
jgi:hypothetical protein